MITTSYPCVHVQGTLSPHPPTHPLLPLLHNINCLRLWYCWAIALRARLPVSWGSQVAPWDAVLRYQQSLTDWGDCVRSIYAKAAKPNFCNNCQEMRKLKWMGWRLGEMTFLKDELWVDRQEWSECSLVGITPTRIDKFRFALQQEAARAQEIRLFATVLSDPLQVSVPFGKGVSLKMLMEKMWIPMLINIRQLLSNPKALRAWAYGYTKVQGTNIKVSYKVSTPQSSLPRPLQHPQQQRQHLQQQRKKHHARAEVTKKHGSQPTTKIHGAWTSQNACGDQSMPVALVTGKSGCRW